jgi:hypothetical protein
VVREGEGGLGELEVGGEAGEGGGRGGLGAFERRLAAAAAGG